MMSSRDTTYDVWHLLVDFAIGLLDEVLDELVALGHVDALRVRLEHGAHGLVVADRDRVHAHVLEQLDADARRLPQHSVRPRSMYIRKSTNIHTLLHTWKNSTYS